MLGKVTQQSLYPDTTYGVNSGGDPKAIPDLTYDVLQGLPRASTTTRPTRASCSTATTIRSSGSRSSTRISASSSGSTSMPTVKLQPRFTAPRQITTTYAASEAEPGKKTGMVTVNWMLDEMHDPETDARAQHARARAGRQFGRAAAQGADRLRARRGHDRLAASPTICASRCSPWA